ncbi:MAG: histidine kinase [Kangiellaceae bacterium]|nr:histidine kinase [Kangiellaceae bacterium]MCW8997447.1 histidine kinase [Kangiellaceae bacterium]MCW9016015.1 histidine kinase [Kangiellaceae bacterium]
MKTQQEENDFFLPDFCQPQSVFFVILIAELLAVIFTLLNLRPSDSMWNILGLYSISIQTVSLFSVAALCLLRPYMARFSDWISGAFSLALIILVTFGFSLVVIKWYWLLPLDFSHQAQASLVVRNLFIAGLIGAVALRYFYLQQQYRRQLVAETNARLQALQARIRPHFLFNSMNVIASLTQIDPNKAELAIQDLSDLFRATLDDKQELIPLAIELENGKKYMAIEQLRMGPRLKVNWDISDDSLSIDVPPLSIQPLLENAVYHGIQQIPEGGEVSIKSRIEKAQLILQVTNPTIEGRRAAGHGIALKNIAQRLEMIYQGKARMENSRLQGEYKVTLAIPAEKDKT